MAVREWTPADLPADFKLFEWDWARNDQIALNAGRVLSITDNWAGRVAAVDPNNARVLSSFGGVQSLFKGGSAADPSVADGYTIDTAGLPSGNADRFLGFCAVMVDGVVGGYRGTGNGFYFIDSPTTNGGVRFTTNATSRQSPVVTDRTTAHWVTASHKSSVSTLRVDGVTGATYNVTLATVLSKFGIVGAQADAYNLVGHSLYAVVGKRAPTDDETWRLEWWVATYKTKKAIPSDNPYATTAPTFDDGQGTVAGVGTATGTTSAAGAGASTSAGTGAATGSTTAAAVGLSIAAGVGTATGSTTAQAAGTGAVTIAATGTATGSTSAVAVGASTARGKGTATGVTAATATGRSTAAGTGTALGSTTATGSGGVLQPPFVLPPPSRRAVLADSGARSAALADTGARRVSLG